jgi:hypothetical protein
MIELIIMGAFVFVLGALAAITVIKVMELLNK